MSIKSNKKKNNKIRENYIDSLRGIAIIFVVVFHYTYHYSDEYLFRPLGDEQSGSQRSARERDRSHRRHARNREVQPRGAPAPAPKPECDFVPCFYRQ